MIMAKVMYTASLKFLTDQALPISVIETLDLTSSYAFGYPQPNPEHHVDHMLDLPNDLTFRT